MLDWCVRLCGVSGSRRLVFGTFLVRAFIAQLLLLLKRRMPPLLAHYALAHYIVLGSVVDLPGEDKV